MLLRAMIGSAKDFESGKQMLPGRKRAFLATEFQHSSHPFKVIFRKTQSKYILWGLQ
jgi:hypothetical protein